MPTRIPLHSGTVCSCSSVPSDDVPGDVAVGCTVRLRCGGEGVGPDCSPRIRSRVICKVWVVFSYFLLGPDVISNSNVDNEQGSRSFRTDPLFKKNPNICSSSYYCVIHSRSDVWCAGVHTPASPACSLPCSSETAHAFQST
jgi:hypothetical protein